jgi:hypothetical protein
MIPYQMWSVVKGERYWSLAYEKGVSVGKVDSIYTGYVCLVMLADSPSE